MHPRFRHLQVPLDFTEKNIAALDIAFEVAVQNKARVTLLHVIEPIAGAEDDETREFIGRLQQRAEVDLESRTQRFAAAGLAVDWKVRVGHRVREIVSDAHDRKVDLIVMSSHAIDPSRPLQSWGTVSYQVSVLCNCPILLVK